MKEEVKSIKLDFTKEVDFDSKDPIHCYYEEDKLTFLNYERYIGPVTMQYLPDGGIQSVFHGTLIIKVKNGFLGVTKLIYKDNEYTSDEFINLMDKEKKTLVNQILL